MTVKYLHVIHSLNPAQGGPAEGVRQLAAAAIRLDHSVEIVTLDPPDNPWSRDCGCAVHCLGPGRLKYGYAPAFIPWLRRNFMRFDAVVVNGIWQYHGYATWRTLRGSGVPYYVFTHGMLDPWFKSQYPLKHIKKLLYWPWAEYQVLRDARAVLFTSEEERLLARQSFRLYRAREIVVNYGSPGLPGDPAAQRETFLGRFPQLRGKRIFLFLGRLHPKKGCDLLIEAFAPMLRVDPALHLVIAGPDQSGMQGQLARLAQHLGVAQSISWPGMVRDDLKAGAFHAAEAFVLPSHQENFGIAVAEALSCGLPVLISNKVNIWREIVTDQAGLVAHDTLQGTRQLLQRWLALSQPERQAMARNAGRCFRQRFHIDTAAINILLLFAQYSGKLEQVFAA
ncbi:MAG TPA: glycosyltransferase [Steroidobacteraceae bacterium]|nr:glycosyltransferase [Steroidobacteraceae bacterium]